MNEKQKTTKKVTIRTIATGFTAVYGIMRLPSSKETLDFVWYGYRINLFPIVDLGIFMGMILCAIIVGGTVITSVISKKDNE